MLKTKCPSCGKEVQVATEPSSGPKRCPACRAVITVPQSASVRRAPVHQQHAEEEGGSFSKPLAKIDQEELIDMTAMVDIVFFLLIFFLVTSMSTIHSSMPIPTPEANKEGGGGGARTIDDIEASGDVIIVRINRDDQVEIDGVLIADLSELPAIFQRTRAKSGSQLGLLVIGHSDATHGRAVTILDAGYEAGMDKVRLAVSDRGDDGR